MRSGHRHYKLVRTPSLKRLNPVYLSPENVKRVERVFPQSEWDFLTQMAAPEYTYTRFLRAIGKFPAFCGSTLMVVILTPSVRNPSSQQLLISLKRRAVTSRWSNTSDNPLALPKSGGKRWYMFVWDGVVWRAEGYTTGCGQNDWQNARWPCAAGQGYFGVVQNSFLTTLTTALSLK